MQPWQRKAIAKGRTPLPESPGLRPWENPDQEEARNDANNSADAPARNEAESSRRYATRATVAANSNESNGPAPAPTPALAPAPTPALAPAGATALATDPAATSASGAPNADQTATPSQSYVFWRGDDLRRLVRMRNGGAKWSTISDAFPDRTLEALKQTYHKRRHATERLMAEEDAAAAAESEAAGPSDGQ